MALTNLRNKRGLQNKPAIMPGGGGAPDAATLQNLYQTAANKGPAAAHSMVGQIGGPQVQAQVQAQMPGGGDDPMKAPRYQKMIADGVDPDVVKRRAESFQQGKLPGQVSGSGQTPGIVPGAPGGGPIAKPAQRPSGQFPINPGAAGGPRPMPAVEPPIPGPGGFGGGPLPPGAWGALGGAPLLPNGQPIGGGAPQTVPYGNDAQVRQVPPQGAGGPAQPGFGAPVAGGGAYGNDAQRAIGSAPGGLTPMISNEPPQGGPLLPNGRPMQNVIAPEPSQGGLQSMNGGGLQAPGRPDMQSTNGGGFQSGPPVPPMANAPTATPDPQQVRQASVARALAGRMAGGAFNQ